MYGSTYKKEMQDIIIQKVAGHYQLTTQVYYIVGKRNKKQKEDKRKNNINTTDTDTASLARLLQIILQLLRLFYQRVESKGRKWPTRKLCKLGEGLDPRQSERVQHGTGTLHTNQNGNCWESC